jgi:serine/threonine protein kinase
MSTAEALPLVQQMASALAAAHAVGIVHRDFKPSNVVLVPCEDSPHGVRAVVTDFGLALRSVRTAASSSSTTLSLTCDFSGTPAYMAPEQIEGRPSTTASDIYALGLVMYEIVSGERPFRGDTPLSVALERLSQAPVSPRTFQPEISPVWERVILRCIERDPSKRFAKVQDVCFALTAHSDSLFA